MKHEPYFRLEKWLAVLHPCRQTSRTVVFQGGTEGAGFVLNMTPIPNLDGDGVSEYHYIYNYTPISIHPFVSVANIISSAEF